MENKNRKTPKPTIQILKFILNFIIVYVILYVFFTIFPLVSEMGPVTPIYIDSFYFTLLAIIPFYIGRFIIGGLIKIKNTKKLRYTAIRIILVWLLIVLTLFLLQLYSIGLARNSLSYDYYLLSGYLPFAIVFLVPSYLVNLLTSKILRV